jgi:hypothetical protein
MQWIIDYETWFCNHLKIFNNDLEPTKSICVIMLIPIDNFFCLIFFIGDYVFA